MNNSQFKSHLIERSYTYSLNILKFIDQLNKNDFIIQVIAKQLLRSTTSVGANIIEAQAGSSKNDFINFLNHALKSANESKYWLRLLRDSGKGNVDTVTNLMGESEEIAKILGSSIRTLRSK